MIPAEGTLQVSAQRITCASSSRRMRAPHANPSASQMAWMIFGMTCSGASDSDNNRVTLYSTAWRSSACLRWVMSVIVATTPVGAESASPNSGCAFIESQSTLPSLLRRPTTSLVCACPVRSAAFTGRRSSGTGVPSSRNHSQLGSK